MNTKDFFYELPPNLIAQTPLEQRDNSRLLVYSKTDDTVQHRQFCDILQYLQKGDVMVVNDTKVLPARIIGKKQDSGGVVELLLHKRLDKDRWEVLARPTKRVHIGTVIEFGDNANILTATVDDKNDDGSIDVVFGYSGIFEETLATIGQMPLPPYIKTRLEDNSRYQTVYARHGESCAAPTAGLHFTSELMNSVRQLGVQIVSVNLTVGIGTFRPVQVDDISEHVMHSEYYTIDKATADTINLAKKEHRRVIAIGTTAVRAIESAANSSGIVEPKSEHTSIFIYPPYKFKVVDAIVTNFHLPSSTLLMLISAFVDRDKILHLYNEAIALEYRFFSFGDAMLIY